MSIARLAPALSGIIGPLVEPVRDGRTSGDLKWALDAIKTKINTVRTRDAYYNGDHNLAFVTKEWQSEFGKMLKSFNANYCPAVVDALADRLRLAGVNITRADTPDESMKATFGKVWTRNRMDRKAGQVHTSMLKHGECYVTAWPNPNTDEVTFFIGRGDRIAVRYSVEDPDEIVFAGKVWMEGKRSRATLYYPDHIERWATNESSVYAGLPHSVTAYEPFGEDWYADNPYGIVPVVPFVNNPTEDGRGKSELDDVIPLQDALNVAMAEMLVALEFAAYPQRWAIGLTEKRDPYTGKMEQALQAGIERLWTSDSNESRFGQFEVANMSNFVTAQDAIRADIARVSRTPINYLLQQGQAVSGEALRVMEAPLMTKVVDRADTTGPSWEALARLTLIEEGALSPDDRDTMFTTQWKDTSTRGDLDHARAVTVRRDLGISQQQGLRELGYEEAKIAEMEIESAEEADATTVAAAGAFNAGATGFGERGGE